MAITRTPKTVPTASDPANLSHIEDALNGVNNLSANAVDMTDGEMTSVSTTIGADSGSGDAGDRSLIMQVTDTIKKILKWDESAGRMRLEDEAAALLPLEVADPTEPTQAATKDYTDTNILNASFPVITGKAPFWHSASQIKLPAGLSCFDSTMTKKLTILSDQTVDISTTGANGRDAGSETSNTWYYVYIIGDSTGVNTPKGLLSTVCESITGSVTLPSGYDLKRQLPLAIKNDGSSNLIDFIVGSGWPFRPRVHFDVGFRGEGATGTAGATEFLTGATASSFTASSAAAFVPPISRFAHFQVSTNGTQNGVAIRATGTSHNGIEGSGTNSGAGPCVPCRLNSSQSIDYKALATSTVWLSVESYEVTEM